MFFKSIISLIFASAVLCTGCTKENLDDCYSGLRLHFTFTLHTDEGNHFGPDVQVVRVYLFDKNGVLRHIQEERGAALTNDYAMDIDIAPGTYTILAWGGSNAEFNNSFHEGHMIDPATHNYINGVTIGETTLTDFRIFLNYGIADDYPEDIMPVIAEFDDLYYGAVGQRQSETDRYLFEQVEVRVGSDTERSVEMIRNTNVLKVTIRGLEYLRNDTPTGLAANPLASDQLQVWAAARNGRYKYDNSIGEYARMLRYFPVYRSLDENSMVVDIKVMQLNMERHTAEPVYLTVQNAATGAMYPNEPIDVVNTLLQAKDPVTGDYIYKNQEDFDRIYEHPIDIKISADLAVTIYVHDWEIVILRPA